MPAGFCLPCCWRTLCEPRSGEDRGPRLPDTSLGVLGVGQPHPFVPLGFAFTELVLCTLLYSLLGLCLHLIKQTTLSTVLVRPFLPPVMPLTLLCLFLLGQHGPFCSVLPIRCGVVPQLSPFPWLGVPGESPDQDQLCRFFGLCFSSVFLQKHFGMFLRSPRAVPAAVTCSRTD